MVKAVPEDQSVLSAFVAMTAAVLRLWPSPAISYTVTLDSTRHDVIHVRLHLERVPASLRLAMKVHHEYDARAWRFLDSMTMRGTADDLSARVVRLDSTLWQVTLPGGHGEVEYAIRLPAASEGLRLAWQCVVRDDGALLNPPDVFLYLPDFASAPTTIELHVPRSWSVTTSLARENTPNKLHAPNAAAMLDAPILLGATHAWAFHLANSDFRVAYWALPLATPFDTTRFVDGLRRLAQQATALFGQLRSPAFDFLLEDGATDALEHSASVTVGVPSVELARTSHARLPEIAHEFFHSWNLVAIHPDHYGELSYKPPSPTSGLWLGEGVTLHYADVLIRRAGLADNDSKTRAEHLVTLLERYYGAAWFNHVSPESASLAFGQNALTNPNATGSYYLQGELLGEALDAAIRDSTHEARTLDDLMRVLYVRSADGRGYTSRELVTLADSLCGCRLDALFATSVAGAAPIDLGPTVKRLGWRLVVDTVPSVDEQRRPVADLRLIGVVIDSSLALIVRPSSQWASLGLRTGDVLVEINGTRPRTFSELSRVLRSLRVGESLTVAVRRGDQPMRFASVVRTYQRPRVRLLDRDEITTEQRTRRARWLSGW
ncbi:MAG TPA: PDZ domain-containing protein [Gemmatimonadaceae bacterium]